MLNKLQEVMQYSSSQIWLSHEIQLCLFGRNYHLLTPSSLSSSDETGHVAALQEMQKFNYASSFTLYGNAPKINQKFWRPFRKENQSYGLFFCIKGMTMCPTLCFYLFCNYCRQWIDQYQSIQRMEYGCWWPQMWHLFNTIWLLDFKAGSNLLHQSFWIITCF